MRIIKNQIITKETKVETFREELSKFENNDIRKFTEICIGELPNYFFYLPSTSSGKYHPLDERGCHGLLLHTARVFDFLMSFLRLEKYSNITPVQKECLMSAALLHDGLKYGEKTAETHTVFEHPKLAAEFVCTMGAKHGYETYSYLISSYIETHSGQWTTSPYSDVVLRKPETLEEELLHLADYSAAKIPNIYLYNI